MDKSLYQAIEESEVLIFDFDGTIADTEPHNWIVINKCLKPYGVVLTEEDILKYIGKTDVAIYSMIKDDFNIKFDNDEMYRDIKNESSIYFSDLKMGYHNYVKDIMEHFKHKRFFVLTSQKRESISFLLDNWGILLNFEKIYSVGDSLLSKRHYLHNSNKYFGCEPNKAILFEDVDSNLLLGKEVGMKTVGVEHQYNKGKLKNYDYLISE